MGSTAKAAGTTALGGAGLGAAAFPQQANDLLFGSQKRLENINYQTPEQQQQFSQLLQTLGPEAQQAFASFLQPQGAEQYQDVFQQTYVDPAMQALQQKILPGIQQRFSDLNAGSSSALNQALAQSATDLSTSLGSQYGQFLQGQQGRQLQALSQFLPMLTQQTFQPQFQQNQGILGPLLQAGGQIGAAFI